MPYCLLLSQKCRPCKWWQFVSHYIRDLNPVFTYMYSLSINSSDVPRLSKLQDRLFAAPSSKALLQACPDSPIDDKYMYFSWIGITRKGKTSSVRGRHVRTRPNKLVQFDPPVIINSVIKNGLHLIRGQEVKCLSLIKSESSDQKTPISPESPIPGT